MKARLEGPQKREPVADGAVTKEIPLHNAIIDYCNSQWPRWRYRHCNPSKKSTDTEGCEDFTIFLPGNKTLHIECKTASGKLSDKQREWIKELEMLGHDVHVVRSFEEFLAAADAALRSELQAAPAGPGQS